MNNKVLSQGFSTLEMMITVGVLGIAATMSVVGYTLYIPHAQAKEAANLMSVSLIEASAQKNGACLQKTVEGKYGTLTMFGSANRSTGSSCPSGCQVKYVFKDLGGLKSLQNKVIAADILNNGKLSKRDETNTPDKYLPPNFKKEVALAGDNCTAQAVTLPTKTDGSVNGIETGLADPPPVTPPVTPPPTGGTTPVTPPSDGTTPVTSPSDGTTPITPPPSLATQVERAKNFFYRGEGYSYAPNRHGNIASVLVPDGEFEDFYVAANWSVAGLSRDSKNTKWKKASRNVPAGYSFAFAGGNSVVSTVVIGSYCAEGGGCDPLYGYRHDIKFYYKGELVNSSVFTSTYEPAAGTN